MLKPRERSWTEAWPHSAKAMNAPKKLRTLDVLRRCREYAKEKGITKDDARPGPLNPSKILLCRAKAVSWACSECSLFGIWRHRVVCEEDVFAAGR